VRHSALCVVRTGSLYIVLLILGCSMAAVIRRLLAAEVWVQFLASLCEICGVHSVTGIGLYPNTSLFSVSIILPRLHTCFNLQGALTNRTRERRLGKFQ
jgi:hypothetical protein